MFARISITEPPFDHRCKGLATTGRKMINQYCAIWFDYHVQSLRQAANSAAAQ